MTGGIYVVLGVAIGTSLPSLLHVLAPGALAGMLAFVAIEHGMLAAKLERTDDRLIAALVGAVTLLAGNLAIGFGAGVLAVLGRAAVARVLAGDRGGWLRGDRAMRPRSEEGG
jgi:hypothetical protein